MESRKSKNKNEEKVKNTQSDFPFSARARPTRAAAARLEGAGGERSEGEVHLGGLADAASFASGTEAD